MPTENDCDQVPVRRWLYLCLRLSWSLRRPSTQVSRWWWCVIRLTWSSDQTYSWPAQVSNSTYPISYPQVTISTTTTMTSFSRSTSPNDMVLATLLLNQTSLIHGSKIKEEKLCCPQFPLPLQVDSKVEATTPMPPGVNLTLQETRRNLTWSMLLGPGQVSSLIITSFRWLSL